jgi:hypothetical protein
MELVMTKDQKDKIASQLFKLANDLAGDQYGHLAAIVHAVVSELHTGHDVFDLIDEIRCQIAMINLLKGARP